METRKVSYKRKFLRAPLNRFMLFEDDGHVYKTRTRNISEEGVLIDSLPHLPAINIISVIFDIPDIPTLSQLSNFDLKELLNRDLDRVIARAKVRTIRRDENQSEVDQVFVRNIGGAIVNVEDGLRFAIRKYVSVYALNTVHLLQLFQQGQNDGERIERIRLLAQALGYDHTKKLAELFQQVHHDYRSLQQL